MTATPPIDRVHLAGFTGGDPVLDMELICAFSENAEKYLDQLAGSDGADWADMAHKIKGAARGIGAFSLGDLAEKAEQLSDKNARAMMLNSLRDALVEVRDYIKNNSEGPKP